MFDLDKWKEIFETIWKNKLRTFLTMLGVSWGIFMLVVMLGANSGLEQGVKYEFSGFATNSFYVWGNKTTMPYQGLQAGRYVGFRNNDADAIAAQIDEVDVLCPRNQMGGYGGSNAVVRKDKSGSFDVMGDVPDIPKVQSILIDEGRFINARDLTEKRKVAVIGERVREILFSPQEDPIGDAIKINGVYFKVIGIFNPGTRSGNDGDRARETIHIPLTTFQQAFNFADQVQWFAVTAKPGVKASQLETQVKSLLAKRHKVAPDDTHAIGSWNTEKEFSKMSNLFMAINFFSFIIGLMTLFAGTIGISNIMLIIVKERTREIGVRKALGATPGKIVSMILHESVFLTLVAGFLGLSVSVLLIDIVNRVMLMMGPSEGQMFRNPEVSPTIALGAIFVLVFAGLVAGLIPAFRASKIEPVKALSDE